MLEVSAYVGTFKSRTRVRQVGHSILVVCPTVALTSAASFSASARIATSKSSPPPGLGPEGGIDFDH